MPIIDSHAHYTRHGFSDSFSYLAYSEHGFMVNEGTIDGLLSDIRHQGIVASIEPGVELESNTTLLDFCEQYPGFVFPAIGVHPTRVAPLGWGKRKELAKYSQSGNIVAIGETGLDYHLGRKEQHRIKQFLWFQYQIILADRLNLPLILHIRNAYAPAIKMLQFNRNRLHGGVSHCFSGSTEEAMKLIKLGFHIGIGGALLQSDDRAASLRKAVAAIPLDRILVETDAPYVLPHFEIQNISKKGKRKIRNSSLILPAVIRQIAEIKNMDAGAVESTLFSNTVNLFKLHPWKAGEDNEYS